MIHEAERQARLEGTQKRVRFLCRDVQQPLPFQENTFTLVTVVTGLLNSLKSPEPLFQEIQRVLRPQGRVAFRLTPQAIGYSHTRKVEWFVTRLLPLGFQYLETVSWTPTYELLVFRLLESNETEI
jgi:ubiquinone/menaquinone biosynthesis C-methylase UbiE